MVAPLLRAVPECGITPSGARSAAISGRLRPPAGPTKSASGHLHQRQRYVYIRAVPATPRKTSWDKLFQTAEAQAGLFTALQAQRAGLYRQLLLRYVEHGRVRRLRRGIYRVVHFPAMEHEALTELWLWTSQVGVFSHETALSLHDLSDVLPRRVHVAVPPAWARRRLRVPEGLVLNYAAVPRNDRDWVGPVPVTTPERTLVDCVRDHVAPDLVEQAIAQAEARGLVPAGRAAELRRLGTQSES